MMIREITSKSVLSASRVQDYALNPYVGCQHKCHYCYAKFMKRFTGHREAWGDFVDVKINAPGLLAREIAKKRVGRVWVSGVCDPYQPLEKRYLLTKRCLEVLLAREWPVTIQTKSALVLRDLEMLKRFPDVEIGFSLATADDKIRRIFEPGAPPIPERIDALATLHAAGIRTFAMIAPLLPGAEALADLLAGTVDHALVDRLNYHYADWVYTKYGMQWARSDSFFLQRGGELTEALGKKGIDCCRLY
jgi:DNA repair photolyase